MSIYNAKKPSNNESVVLPLPVSREFFKVLEEVKRKNNNAKDLSDFQESCFKAAVNKKDPMQCFIKSNLISSPYSKDQFSPLSETDISVISSFMREANLTSNFPSDEKFPSIGDSGLVMSTFLSNLKKNVLDIRLDSDEGLDIKSIKIKLIKVRGKNREVFKTYDTRESCKVSEQYHGIQKIKEIGS